MRRAFRLAAMAVALWVAACGGSAPPPPKSGSTIPMTPAEARAYLSEVQVQRGLPLPQHAPVTSMDELVAIISTDNVSRFGDAVEFVQGKPGIDAITLHAAIELAWSDSYSTVAALAEEFGKRAKIEEDRLKKQRDEGKVFTNSETRTLEQASAEAATLDRTKRALRVLADDHLRAASVPVGECLRQFERDPKSFRVAAFYYLLAADWPSFDKAMSRYEHYEGDAGIQYLRALESLKRYGVRKDARDQLDDALRIDPRMVRAQAKLVLIEDGIDEMNAELQKLREMNPTHLIVGIAGPSIKREYDFSTSLSRAKAAQSTPPK
ncbi:MAG: hypothetical protein ABW133_04135 [Polyangiaceae bacterium]